MELKDIKGIGAARLGSLNEAGIFSCEDLLNHFPKKYYDFNSTEAFCDDGAYRMLKVKLNGDAKVVRARGNLNFVSVAATDNAGNKITLVWFNQTFLKATLHAGDELFVYGKNSNSKHNTFNVSMHKKASDEDADGLFSVYKTFNGLGQATIKNCVNACLSGAEVNSFLTPEIEKFLGEISLMDGFRLIHMPKSLIDVDKGFERVSLERAIVYAYINERRLIFEKQPRKVWLSNIEAEFEKFCKIVPFLLTNSQKTAIEALNCDFCSDTSCNRLIQGDTGSGKTLVALWAMFLAAENGYQSVLIAPTQILATQHFLLANALFKNCNFGIEILKNGQKIDERREILRKIRSGDAKMVFATTSVLSDEVVFGNLQIVVGDEQHRFGVNERARLAGKSAAVDFISLSATPIPRSVSLVLFGGLDITRMEARPFDFNIQTNIVSQNKIMDMWRFILAQTEEGRTCFVVCPKIDDDEEKDEIMSTTKLTKSLKTIFGDAVAELNGKMKDEKKNALLADFKAGKIKVLVATTVVEVGIDSADAGVIVIMNPERFGLATLHQLRGRVGRDGRKGYCFCAVTNPIAPKALERLKFFKDHLNGFEIADYDLKTRGAGDIYGTRQHGIESAIDIDLSTYTKAQKILQTIKTDPHILARLEVQAEKLSNALTRDIALN